LPEPMHVQVVTPERPVFDGPADFIVVPAHDGEMGILPRHARFLGALGLGELRITRGANLERYFLDGGFVQVTAEKVTVLCDHCTPLDGLDAAALGAAAAQAKSAGAPNAAALAQRAAVANRIAARARK